jgi:nitrogenase molybdenum-iron protein NifN
MDETKVSKPAPSRSFVSTRNACRLCAPLGACVAFRGVAGCVPLVHGSQGCATYIRRYGISHFREPIDVASSNFTEASAIFGGRDNLAQALDNVTRQYAPAVIGIASTCLSETIGDNVPMYLGEYERSRAGTDGPALVYASTPSYRGSHIDGYHEAIFAIVSALVPHGIGAVRSVDSLALPEPVAESESAAKSETAAAPSVEPKPLERVNLISGFVSAEDLRELREIMESFGRPFTLLPDYSDTLDGSSWETYQKLPEGGTPIAEVRSMGEAKATLYLGRAMDDRRNAGAWLERECGVHNVPLDLPIGIEATDRFFEALVRATGIAIPEKWSAARGRLVDAYIDGHKYCAGKKAIVYGDEDFACAIAAFLVEIGVKLTIVATGAQSSRFAERLRAGLGSEADDCAIMDDADFATILDVARDRGADFAIGNGKGLYLSRQLGIPLVRCGFPIHDRMGAQRILHLGYRGTVNLFDLVCNALMESRQAAAPSGYTYI